MADPRFYRNQGPFDLAVLCEAAGMALPSGADGAFAVADVAGLDGAGPAHLSFFAGGRELAAAFAGTHAGFCLVPQNSKHSSNSKSAPKPTLLLPCASVSHAFAAIAARFYPDAMRLNPWQDQAVAPTARLGRNVLMGPGATVGAGAEIGDNSSIGANAVIGPGVTIGRDCEIGSNVTVTYAHIGDRVIILPWAQVGQSGFGFAASETGHVNISELGRVIIQDGVEIGAGTSIARGALGDTVIGEGSKLDNLVQVGHNVSIGRHCILVSQVGIAGSSVIEDFAVLGGQVGIADHVHVGQGARLAARSACVSGQIVPPGQDYGGVPAKPIREWLREIYAVSRLARAPSRTTMADPTADIVLDVDEIKKVLPHRSPFLFVERLTDIVPQESAVGWKLVRGDEPFFQGHFPGYPVMPGVLIVEALAQTAGAAVSYTLDLSREKRIVYFMTIEKARFRKPVRPGDLLRMPVRAIKNRGQVFRYEGKAFVGDTLVAEAEFTAMIHDGADDDPSHSAG